VEEWKDGRMEKIGMLRCSPKSRISGRREECWKVERMGRIWRFDNVIIRQWKTSDWLATHYSRPMPHTSCLATYGLCLMP